MTTSYQQEKQLIIEIGRRLWLRGMVAANDGNISCRVPGGYLITRSGISKGFMSEEAVSYTHLDVYKRQDRDQAAALSCINQ